jgi:Ankyrin repeats (3 copies)
MAVKASTDSKKTCGQPLLWVAARDGDKEMVDQLLSGADVRCNATQTPLSYAAAEGHKMIVQLLIARVSTWMPRTDMDKRRCHMRRRKGM